LPAVWTVSLGTDPIRIEYHFSHGLFLRYFDDGEEAVGFDGEAVALTGVRLVRPWSLRAGRDLHALPCWRLSALLFRRLRLRPSHFTSSRRCSPHDVARFVAALRRGH
jgi:hypothetical protein